MNVDDSQATVGGVPVDLPADRQLKVFISYRYAEMSGTAWAVYLGLKERFDADNMFLDNSTLHGGMQWLDEIRSHVAGAGAFLALIGPNWMQSLTDHQQRGDVDWVVKETDLALQSRPHVTVIPVLVDGAEVPESSELPPALRGLLDCQAERLHHNNLLDDIQHLADRLSEIRENLAPTRGPDIPEPEPSSGGDNGQSSGLDIRGQDPVLVVEDDHFEELVEEAAYLVVFLGAGANADDHDGPWRQGSMLPDDIDLANYLANKVRLKSGRPDLAEIAQ